VTNDGWDRDVTIGCLVVLLVVFVGGPVSAWALGGFHDRLLPWWF
jgi:hypothetical protein